MFKHLLHQHNYILIILACLGLHQQVVVADDRKTASELVRSRGFDVDEFDVISPQNYPMKAYRIINPLADPNKLNRIPVVAGHGISFDFSSMMPSSKRSRPRKPSPDEQVTLYSMEEGQDDRCLYFYLSNNNYDVWLVETRGSSHLVGKRLFEGDSSRNSKSFWDFSLDEQALIDLPTMIDFVRHKTNSEKVAFIGYSQSTTLMFALLSFKPEFADKLSCFIALAPVAFTTHLTGLTMPTFMGRYLTTPSMANASIPDWFRRMLNFYLTYACSISFVKTTLCRTLWSVYVGPDNKAEYDGGLIVNPIKPTSLKTFDHYLYNKQVHAFRMYDYRDDKLNIERYGQPVPPEYNISNIRLRTIALFRGTDDFMSNPADQMVLINRLKVPLYEDHILEDYGHIDFLASPKVTQEVNEPILKILDRVSDRKVLKVRHTLFDKDHGNNANKSIDAQRNPQINLNNKMFTVGEKT